jgi:hypothetical protein
MLFNKYKLEISFAHRTFAWGSDARGQAHVHVVIIGLARRDMEPKEKRLFAPGHSLRLRHRDRYGGCRKRVGAAAVSRQALRHRGSAPVHRRIIEPALAVALVVGEHCGRRGRGADRTQVTGRRSVGDEAEPSAAISHSSHDVVRGVSRSPYSHAVSGWLRRRKI